MILFLKVCVSLLHGNEFGMEFNTFVSISRGTNSRTYTSRIVSNKTILPVSRSISEDSCSIENLDCFESVDDLIAFSSLDPNTVLSRYNCIEKVVITMIDDVRQDDILYCDLSKLLFEFQDMNKETEIIYEIRIKSIDKAKFALFNIKFDVWELKKRNQQLIF